MQWKKLHFLAILNVNEPLVNLFPSTDDFSGPAESASFPLGSLIPIMASVEQHNHQPLLLLLDECVAATTPDLWSDNTYTIISNKGYVRLTCTVVCSSRCLGSKNSFEPPRCLLDSKVSRSRFETRRKSNEIQLLLQAFKFGLEEEVNCLTLGCIGCRIKMTFTIRSHSSGIYPLHTCSSRSKWAGQHQKGLSL